MPRICLTSALLAASGAAKISWNLESAVLKSLESIDADKINHALFLQEEYEDYDHEYFHTHVYPAWVSETTCSTLCVDIHNDEEFCVATTVCQHAKWHNSFEKFKINHNELQNLTMSESGSHCAVWGGQNLCDGILCGEHEDCLSECCGSFVSFTHDRCLPVLGDYCPGKDASRVEYSHRDHHFERNDLMHASSESSEDSIESNDSEPNAESIKRSANAARDMMLKLDKQTLLNLAQEDNKSKKRGKKHAPCEQDGSKDMCDGFDCKTDGACRSGCCSQVLTKGYKRCSPMLVGDYCPRALDPVFLLKDAFLDELDAALGKIEKEIEGEDKQEQEPAHTIEKDIEIEEVESHYEPLVHVEVEQPVAHEAPHHAPKKEAPRIRDTEPSELPCNVFGTVDRCDGMACEHDGNCFSGCCSLFISGATKRCMPLVNNDMCPIAIDIVQPPTHDVEDYEPDHQIVEKELAPEEEYQIVQKEPMIEEEYYSVEKEFEPDHPEYIEPPRVPGPPHEYFAVEEEYDPSYAEVFAVQKEFEPDHPEHEIYDDYHVESALQDYDDHYYEPHHEEYHDVHPIAHHEDHHQDHWDDTYDEDEAIGLHLGGHQYGIQKRFEEEYSEHAHQSEQEHEHELAEREYQQPIEAHDTQLVKEHQYGQAYEQELHRDFGPEHSHLTPRFPDYEDSRIRIPEERAKEHHSVAAQKQAAIDAQKAEEERILKEAEPKPVYGESYEQRHKDGKKPMKPLGHGIRPKLDQHDRPVTTDHPRKETNPEVKAAPIKHSKSSDKTSKTPCSTYSKTNKCEGMPCEDDIHCASGCCSTAMGNGNGAMTCHAVIQGSFCPRALAPKVDYSMYQDHKVDYSGHVNSLEMAGLEDHKTHYSNDLPVYKGKGGCHVTGFVNQCDGQPCSDDDDCFSGCCGHFVSFSLRRCLPLTDDELCPRFLEPTYRSPVPSQLPPIESTISDMYHIQDRIRHVESFGNDNAIFEDEPMCRSHGQSYLCDGFTCDYGSGCKSGCCGAFGSQKDDYCLPLVNDYCPIGNISYGDYGNSWEGQGQEDDSIPIPPAFDGDGNADDIARKENAFWAGVVSGVAIWVLVLLSIGAVYLCYKKGNGISRSEVSNHSSYRDLPSSQQVAVY